MATTTNLQLETHGSGTVGLSGIIDGNWARLDEIFDPALSSGDPSFGAFWKAFVRNATNPTTEAAVLEWDLANTRPRWQAGFAAITYAASLSIDCQAGIEQEVSLTGTLTFTSLTNQAEGSKVTVILRGDGSSRNLNFPAGWIFVGSAEPSALAAGKTAILELRCTGATDADVVAKYFVEP